MSRISLGFALVAVLVLSSGCGDEAPAGTPATETVDPGALGVDLEGLAHTLVTRNAPIREGDMVVIFGSPRDLELAENLAVQVRRLGAHPLLQIETERLRRRLWDDVPVEFDSQRWEWEWALAEIVDHFIVLDVSETPDLLAHVPPERFAARAEANTGLQRLFGERGVTLVDIGNNLYPTEARARRFELSRNELARLFWSGVQADPDEIRAVADRVVSALEGAREVRITHPDGTDLTVGIEGRQIRVMDGRVPEDVEVRRAEGGETYLPAGEVFLSMVPGSAEGRVVLERTYLGRNEVHDLELRFERGELVSFEATSGLEEFRAMYELAPPGRERLTVLDFGVNPGITNHRILTWSVSGMVTIQLGEDVWAGGSLEIPYGPNFHLPGTTVHVDGRLLIEDGVLRL